ncbi:hypothetical protein Pelo_9622 [Pelomyxa schiedti]|nr:hypothetical protein Pelo_9622 [Pelomyxa schiedti]
MCNLRSYCMPNKSQPQTQSKPQTPPQQPTKANVSPSKPASPYAPHYATFDMDAYIRNSFSDPNRPPARERTQAEIDAELALIVVPSDDEKDTEWAPSPFLPLVSQPESSENSGCGISATGLTVTVLTTLYLLIFKSMSPNQTTEICIGSEQPQNQSKTEPPP